MQGLLKKLLIVVLISVVAFGTISCNAINKYLSEWEEKDSKTVKLSSGKNVDTKAENNSNRIQAEADTKQANISPEVDAKQMNNADSDTEQADIIAKLQVEQGDSEKTQLESTEQSYESELEEENRFFWIAFLDVGQGDSAIVQCDGHYMLIDGGSTSASSVVYSILKKLDIDYLDYIIATHPDEDHIGGLSGALNYASAGVCYSPVLEYESKPFESLVKYLNKQNASLVVPLDDTTFQLGDATVELFIPFERCSDINNNSIVTKVTYKNESILFMGDAEEEEENALLDAGKDLSCDILKAGHHGSGNSTGERLLKKANPKYVVISVGAENGYEHPTSEVLKRLSEVNVSILRTDMQGNILCLCDGKELTIDTEKKASEEALWLPGPSANVTEIKNGIVVPAPEKAVIPEGTTYVLNTSTRKFHYTTCKSVSAISEKNRAYSTDTAEALVASGYKPCGNCNPYVEYKHEEQIVSQDQIYVLNTNTKKFHYPNCSSVSAMVDRNRKDVTMSREEIINKGYSPCKRCNP